MISARLKSAIELANYSLGKYADYLESREMRLLADSIQRVADELKESLAEEESKEDLIPLEKSQ